MTGWSFCLAEIVLYAVVAGLVIAIALDARTRWKELLEDQEPDEPDGEAPDPDDPSEVSARRRKDEDAGGDDAPPPAS